jgi:hypothetical protein
MPTEHDILINRTPVLTLWVATVAERLGFDEDEALSLGKAVAGMNAQSKDLEDAMKGHIIDDGELMAKHEKMKK